MAAGGGRGRAHSFMWAWSCDTDSRAVPCSSLKIWCTLGHWRQFHIDWAWVMRTKPPRKRSGMAVYQESGDRGSRPSPVNRSCARE